MSVSIGLQANVTVLATTTVIAAAEATRVGGAIQNQGNAIVWLGFDIPAVVNAGFELKPGETFDFGQGFSSAQGNGTDFFIGAVNGISEASQERGSTPAAMTSVVRVGTVTVP